MSPKKTARRFVAYYRVSTDRQGRSGLGLEAQQSSVRNYLNGGEWELIGEFTEIESGKHADRPELVKALEVCRRVRRPGWLLPSWTGFPAIWRLLLR